ncbi:MAG: lamin tail domain-containing protein [Kiritimatiellae bacterium]|nr:lamin tail domain-containing protein [Kiritimatiellia bacterium]
MNQRRLAGILAIFAYFAVILLPVFCARAETLIASATTWRYAKGTREASDPRDEWRAADFADAAWANGRTPIGYGDAGLNTTLGDMKNTYSSFFLRKTFTVNSLTPDTRLRATVTYDDGFILWINGERVTDKNEPDGSPLHDSLAAESFEGTETIELSDPNDYLEMGENVVAVQVFNQALDSSDAAFDLALESYQRVADTTFSHDRGFYSAAFTCTIASATPGATIRYTLNGDDPRTASDRVSGTAPLGVLIDPANGSHRLINGAKAPCVVLRAYALKSGYEPTDVDTQTYVFPDTVIRQPECMAGEDWVSAYEGTTRRWTEAERQAQQNTEMQPSLVSGNESRLKAALEQIATVSIVMPYADLFGNSRGINHNSLRGGENWKRAGSIELIEPPGAGLPGFRIDCAVSVAGGAVREPSKPKHSFNLAFKPPFGPTKLAYPLYPESSVETFDGLRLRGLGEDGHSLKDPWVFQIQRDMGWAAAYHRIVHVYLNGMYWGLYTLTERPTGSYYAAHVGGEKDDWDTITHPNWHRSTVEPAVYGEGPDYDPNLVSGDYAAYNAMKAIGSLSDPAQYAKRKEYLDMPQYIDFMLIGIYGANPDWGGNARVRDWKYKNYRAGRRSRNWTPADGGFKYMIWDYDDACNAARLNADYVVASGLNGYCDLRVNVDFKMEFADHIYSRLIRSDGMLAPAHAKMRFAALTNEAQSLVSCEAARWGDVRTHYTDPPAPQTQADYWEPRWRYLQETWFPQRPGITVQDFKDNGWYPTIAPPTFKQDGGAIAPGFKLTMSNPTSYALHYTLDGSDPRRPGGSRSPAGLAYSGPITLSRTTHVKARLYKSNGTWSALHEATFNYTAHYGNIRFTEIMYNPLGGGDFEFIEIRNTGSSTRGLSRMTLKGVRYTFPAGAELAGGETALLVANEGVFTNRYPAARSQAAFFGVYCGRLDNGGERVALLDCEGRTVTSVRYNDKDPWPGEADGDGFSLVAADPSGDPDDPAKWRASNLIGGSPGYDDGAPYRVVISEALAHTDPPQVDAIELYNAGSAGADVGGWYLSDSVAAYRKFRIPNGTTVPAGGYVVFDEHDFNTNTNDPACFALSSHGDEVYLTRWDSAGNLQYLAEARFGGSENGVAFARYVKSDGDADFVAQAAADTLGGANAVPRVGPVVINEILYHPSDAADASAEFIELLNVTGTAVKLYDPANPANRWRLAAAVDYEFPAGTELAAGEYVLVVPTNEATFRAAYPGVPAGVRVFGPCSGRLGNGGESVKLWRPDAPDPEGVPWILVDRVQYGDNSPWPENADGGGPSLERLDPRAYGNDVVNWTASLAPGGTPGLPNSGCLVPKTGGWKYHDRGENLGTTWRMSGYDDGGWADGNAPLGYPGTDPAIDTEVSYGDDPSQKYVTTYFRKRFTLAAAPGDVSSLTLRVRYDDGFVAYLNGLEVARGGMPTGGIGYDTLATGPEVVSYQSFNLSGHAGKLVQGVNVLAVEVHQSSRTSSDIFMDLDLVHEALQGNPPAAPQSLQASAVSSSRIDLAWSDRSDDETGFKVDRRQSGTDTWVRVATVGADTSRYSDSGLSAGTTYYYMVKAYNGYGNSACTGVAGATTDEGPPDAPTGLSATAVSYSRIELTWQDESGNETGFKLDRRQSGGDWVNDLAALSAGSTAYADSGLPAETKYYYRVRATNAVGDSDYSNVADATTPADVRSFTAYNDLAWASGQLSANITTHTRSQTGFLVDYDTGRQTAVTLAVNSGGSSTVPDRGAPASAGTDADTVFGGKVDCTGLIEYGAALDLTFAGLDAALRYEVVLFGNRDNPLYTDRTAIVTISSADAFSNASTPGVGLGTTSMADDTATVVNGYNTQNGHVARFRNVAPGADGVFTISVSGATYYVNALMLRTAQGEEATVKIAKGAEWHYRRGTAEASDPVGAWRRAGFDDSGWAVAPAPFGYGALAYGTTLSDMRNSYTCVFLRRTFSVQSTARISALNLDVDYDDGFVMWLNGREIARVNVPGTAGDPVAHDDTGGYVGAASANWSAALAGATLPAFETENVLAVQVFNNTPNSSDLMFDAESAIVNSQLPIVNDADQDGMPDAWEAVYLADLSDPADRADSADPDGDGLSNLEEYITGTDPRQNGSCFAVDVGLSAGQVVIAVPTVAASGAGYEGFSRHYALERRAGADPALPWVAVPGYENRLGTGATVNYAGSDATGCACYRGRVWLE